MKLSTIVIILLTGFGARQLYRVVTVAPTLPSPSPDGQDKTIRTHTIQDTIESYISSNKVIVFSKTYCGFSKRAKSVLGRYLGWGNFKVVEIDELADGEAMMDYLKMLTGQRTVPQIFVNGKSLGGYSDIAALDDDNKLQEVLNI